MYTTFILYVITNYFPEKRYSRSNVENQQKWRIIFASIFSGPGELLGKMTPVKSKARQGFFIDRSILCKNFMTLALIVTEEMHGQVRPLKSD